MLGLITAATLSITPPRPAVEPTIQPMPAICLALAPKLVDSVAEGVITRKQAAEIFMECLKEFKGKGAQF